MEWMREILEKAVITDGKLDVDATLKAVNAEFPKHAVPKQEYNAKVEELKTANGTIKKLQEENGDNAELQKKVVEYETEIQTLRTAAETSKKEYVLKGALEKSGALDADYIIFKHGGVDKFTFDKDGKPVGIEDVVKPLKEASPHLFKTEAGTDYKPNSGGNAPVNNPWAKDTFNLTEQGKIFTADPARAKMLAAAAGVTI